MEKASGREGLRDKVRENILHVSVCAYRGLVLMQHLVVSTECHTENDGCYILKTVDPLLPLRPLTSNIKQPEAETQE